MTNKTEAIAEALARLTKIYENNLRPCSGGTYSESSEEGHMEADDILRELVVTLMDGDRSVADKYESIGKWYA